MKKKKPEYVAKYKHMLSRPIPIQLAEHIVLPLDLQLSLPSLLNSPNDWKEKVVKNDTETQVFLRCAMQEKMALLLGHYGLEAGTPINWGEFAFKIAQDFVPGFTCRLEKRRGGAQIWDSDSYALLWFDVQLTILQDSCKDRAAYLKLLDLEPWKSGLKSLKRKNTVSKAQANAHSMENRYSESKESEYVKWFNALPEIEQIKKDADKLKAWIRMFANILYIRTGRRHPSADYIILTEKKSPSALIQ